MAKLQRLEKRPRRNWQGWIRRQFPKETSRVAHREEPPAWWCLDSSQATATSECSGILAALPQQRELCPDREAELAEAITETAGRQATADKASITEGRRRRV